MLARLLLTLTLLTSTVALSLLLINGPLRPAIVGSPLPVPLKLAVLTAAAGHTPYLAAWGAGTALMLYAFAVRAGHRTVGAPRWRPGDARQWRSGRG